MSNVLEFKRKEPQPPRYYYDIRLEYVNDELDLISVKNADEMTIDDKAFLAFEMFKAAWWMGRDISGQYDDSRDLLCQIAVFRGGGLRVYAPSHEHADSFQTEEQQAWLLRRFKDAYQMALPSWSEEQTPSGTTSPSHSANFDQLEFSW